MDNENNSFIGQPALLSRKRFPVIFAVIRHIVKIINLFSQFSTGKRPLMSTVVFAANIFHNFPHMNNSDQDISQSLRRLQWLRYCESVGILFALQLFFMLSKKKVRRTDDFNWR